MNNLSGLVFGGGGITGQIDRIIFALKQYNCNINESNVNDFLFHGNHWYSEAETYEENKELIKIYNVLDIPIHIKDFNYKKHKEKLLKANHITCISNFVKNQIKEFYNLDAINIGYPIKDLTKKYVSSQYKYLIIGRLSDPNKRVEIAQKALISLKIPQSEIALIGPEYPPINYGHFFGSISDEDLNIFYSGAEYILCPSRIEGLCLPSIEATCHGVIPIICNDMSTRQELFENIGLYNQISPNYNSIAESIKYLENNIIEKNKIKESLKKIGKNFSIKYNKYTIAKNILDIVIKSNN